MKKIIYIEKKIKSYDRVKNIVNRHPNSDVIYIDKYTEVFNKKNQNFRLQKKNPSLLIAKKHDNFLNKIPEKYGIGNKLNYYFSYMYNCLFDCKYCFLQGLYNSANYVIFINYEDYFKEIESLKARFEKKKITIFSGYDCDSLAYNAHTGFIEEALSYFSKTNNIELEIRTKSTFIKPLLRQSLENVVVAYSFTPPRFSNKYETGVPSVEKRLASISRLVNLDWKIGLRFDPFVIYEGWEQDYTELFSMLFNVIPKELIHSVTFGNLRYPKSLFKRLYLNNSQEKIFFSLKKNGSLYEDDNKTLISEFFNNQVIKYVNKEKIFQNF